MKYYGTIANNYDIVNKGYVDANIPTKLSELENDSGFLSSIPIATSTTLGGVKVGSGLSITAEGLLSAVTATLASLGITATAGELNYSKGVTSAIQTQLNSKVGANSPAFTGIPTAPTASYSTNNTQIATTAFVKSVLSNSPALAGTPTAPTATGTTNNTQIATTAHVKLALSASPSLGGSPTAPTPATGTNSTRIATTAFVQSTISALGDLASITVSASQPSGQPAGAFWFQVV